jgi:hypothetical protein
MRNEEVIIVAAIIGAIATPDEVGVRVGPVGAGVTVGEPHDQYRDHDRDHTTVIKSGSHMTARP